MPEADGDENHLRAGRPRLARRLPRPGAPPTRGGTEMAGFQEVELSELEGVEGGCVPLFLLGVMIGVAIMAAIDAASG